MIFNSKTKKFTSTVVLLLITAMVCSVICLPSMEVSAAVTGNVSYTAADFTSSVGITKVEGQTSYGLGSGKALGYEIDFDTEPTTMNITTGSYAPAAGVIEVHLDTKDGPLLATFKTGTTPNWSTVTASAKITHVFSGKHTIWFVAKSGTQDFNGFGFWIPGANAGRYPAWPGVDNYTDISNSEYREEINMLKSMKIFGDADEETLYRGNIAATRGDFAIAMANLFNVEAGNEAANIFTDIQKDDVYCAAVTELLHLNIIKADKKTFRATDYITYDEAAEWMVAALGLDYQVKSKNLRRVVNDMKLFYAIEEDGKYVTREKMAKLLVNTIQAENAVLSEFKPGDWYKFEEGDGILSYQGIYRESGIVEANGYYDLYSNEGSASSSDVIIDGVAYNVGKTNAPNYFGMHVDFLWKNGERGKTLVGIMSSEESEVFIMNSQDYELVDITEKLITYYPDDKTKKVEEIELEEDTVFFYNDKLVDQTFEHLLGSTDGSLFDGTIQFISNDGNKKDYEIVRIYHMESMIFGGYHGNSFYDNLCKEEIPFDNMKSLLIYDSGNLVDVAAIPYGTVLDVYRSKNKDGDMIFRANYSNRSVEGYITSRDTDGVYTLDNGKKYEKYNVFTDDLYVGQEGKFLINSYDRIIGVEPVATDQYGLFTEATKEDFGFGDGAAMMKLYPMPENTTGVEKVYTFAEKAYVNGVKADNYMDIYNAISNLTAFDPVRFRTDENGLVTLIDTPGEDNGPRDCLRELRLDYTDDGVTDRVYVWNNTIRNQLTIGAIQPVASDVIWANVYSSANKNFVYSQVGCKNSTDDKKLSMRAYASVHNLGIANIVVEANTGLVPASRTDRALMVVTEVVTKYENENTEIYIKGLKGKATAEYKINKELYETDSVFRNEVDLLKRGDLISPAVSDGLLNDLLYIYVGDQRNLGTNSIVVKLDKTVFNTGEGGRQTEGVYYHGTITERVGDFIKLDCGGKIEWINTDSKNVIVCEKDGSIFDVENGRTSTYLGVGEHVFAGIIPWDYAPNTLVVYRNYND